VLVFNACRKLSSYNYRIFICGLRCIGELVYWYISHCVVDLQTESTSCNMIIATASQQSTPSLSDVYLGSVNMHYSDENMAQTDIKPTVESGVQQWTPSKRLMMSPSKTLLSSPTGIKTEVCTAQNCFVKVFQFVIHLACLIAKHCH